MIKNEHARSFSAILRNFSGKTACVKPFTYALLVPRNANVKYWRAQSQTLETRFVSDSLPHFNSLLFSFFLSRYYADTDNNCQVRRFPPQINKFIKLTLSLYYLFAKPRCSTSASLSRTTPVRSSRPCSGASSAGTGRCSTSRRSPATTRTWVRFPIKNNNSLNFEQPW